MKEIQWDRIKQATAQFKEQQECNKTVNNTIIYDSSTTPTGLEGRNATEIECRGLVDNMLKKPEDQAIMQNYDTTPGG